MGYKKPENLSSGPQTLSDGICSPGKLWLGETRVLLIRSKRLLQLVTDCEVDKARLLRWLERAQEEL